MYLQKSFAFDCSDACSGSHDLDASGFTCLDNIMNSQMLCRSISGLVCIPCTNISGFDGIAVTVKYLCRNVVEIYIYRDANTNLLCRDISRDDYRIPLLRNTSRDGRRNSLCRDVSRDNSRCTIVEIPL